MLLAACSFCVSAKYFKKLQLFLRPYLTLSDEGRTGTKLYRRDDFQQMMEDCRQGKIDLILTKSVTRFARNTLDSIKAIRELKALGIGVYFEKERVNTLMEKNEQMITILSSIAHPYQSAIYMFDNNLAGSCYGIASAVAACARVLGYEPYVIATTGDHGFVMIDGLYYDNMGPLFGASTHFAYSVRSKVKF